MARRKRGRTARPADARAIGEAISYPGIDPRQWVSYGVVDAGEPVAFDPDYGPLVAVTLKPSEVEVTARVAMTIAGNGEGEFFPFVEGDEVLVALPGGSERADVAIIGRMSNARSKFPAGPVAGQDPSTNAFAFKRTRTPFVQEAAGPVMLRQASSEAFLSIDEKGTVTIRDGQAAGLQLSPDVFGYQNGDARFLLQLDLTGGRFTLQVDDALLVLASSSASPEASTVTVPGVLAVSTYANPAAEHALSLEAWANIMVALGLVMTPPVTAAQIAAAITAASETPLVGVVGTAIVAAFAKATQKPPAVPAFGQLKPGVGSPGLLIG